MHERLKRHVRSVAPSRDKPEQDSFAHSQQLGRSVHNGILADRPTLDNDDEPRRVDGERSCPTVISRNEGSSHLAQVVRHVELKYKRGDDGISLRNVNEQVGRAATIWCCPARRLLLDDTTDDEEVVSLNQQIRAERRIIS